MWHCCKYAPLSACQFSVNINFPKFYAKLITQNIKIGLQTNSKGSLLANTQQFPFWTRRHLLSHAVTTTCAVFLASCVPRPAPMPGCGAWPAQLLKPTPPLCCTQEGTQCGRKGLGDTGRLGDTTRLGDTGRLCPRLLTEALSTTVLLAPAKLHRVLHTQGIITIQIVFGWVFFKPNCIFTDHSHGNQTSCLTQLSWQRVKCGGNSHSKRVFCRLTKYSCNVNSAGLNALKLALQLVCTMSELW